MGNLLDIGERILELRSITVMMHTEDCVTHMLEHPCCWGCMHELVCSKYISIGLYVMKGTVDAPVDDYHTYERIFEAACKIADAKTVEEVQELNEELEGGDIE